MQAVLLLSSLALAGAIVCPPASKESLLKENLKAEGQPCGGACDSEGFCADGFKCIQQKPPPLSFAIILNSNRPGVCTRPEEKHTMLGEDPATYAPVAKQHLLGEDPATYAPAAKPAAAPKELVFSKAAAKEHLLGEDPATYAPQPSKPLLGADPATWTPKEPLLGQDPKTWGPNVRKLQLGLMGGVSDADINSKEVMLAAKACVQWMLRATNSLDPPTFKRVVSASKQVVAGIKYILEIEMTDGSHHVFEIVDQPWVDESSRYTVASHTPKRV